MLPPFTEANVGFRPVEEIWSRGLRVPKKKQACFLQRIYPSPMDVKDERRLNWKERTKPRSRKHDSDPCRWTGVGVSAGKAADKASYEITLAREVAKASRSFARRTVTWCGSKSK
jgi:hypothetical protein